MIIYRERERGMEGERERERKEKDRKRKTEGKWKKEGQRERKRKKGMEEGREREGERPLLTIWPCSQLTAEQCRFFIGGSDPRPSLPLLGTKPNFWDYARDILRSGHGSEFRECPSKSGQATMKIGNNENVMYLNGAQTWSLKKRQTLIYIQI